MILAFKQHLPNGTPTHFVEKIIQPIDVVLVLDVPENYIINNDYQGPAKLHSIRQGNRWKSGMAIHMAYGSRTPNYWQFNKGIQQLSNCISTQDVFMTYAHNRVIQISIDDRELFSFSEREAFALNDGFDSWNQFFEWFYPLIKSHKDEYYKGQIIHWTNLRY